jgi:SHS family lactate transporter-like MFS transporter
MSGLLQGTWGLGFALSGLAYWLLLDAIGWRGLLWLAALPAPIVCAYIHYCVKEPEVWVENRKRQREAKKEVRAPLADIFKPALLGNTLTACWWVAGVMVVYYSVNGLFATWLQTDKKLAATVITVPIVLSNLAVLVGEAFWGRLADGIGRRGAIIIQAAIACIVAPVYLLTDDLTWIITGFVVQGAFGTSLPGLTPAYLTERFPTEVRCTASAFCYHVGIVIAGLVPPAISYLAVEQHMGFAVPMLIGTVAGSVSAILALLVSPETKGKVFVAKLMEH